MIDFAPGASSLLLASVMAYFLGALPLGDQISRRHGVDIFTVGTGLAGAANVRRCVGNVSGLLVLIGDMSKGALAILVGQRVGVEDSWLVLLVLIVVVGHWKPVFTRFHGGDGLSPLGGAMIAMFPVFGPISFVVAMVVALGAKLLPYPSLLSVVFGYGALTSLVIVYHGNYGSVLGMGAVSCLVLVHAMLGHRWRNIAIAR